jgi:hypothetical protein
LSAVKSGAAVEPATFEPSRDRRPFTDTIQCVTYDLSGEVIIHDEAELARLMAQR